MRRAPLYPAIAIVAEARVLRRAEPQMTVLDVLDQVMRGRTGRPVEFGELATPPAPFALLVAEAFDGGMLPSDWVGLWCGNSHPRIRAFLLQLWADEVWPQFIVRYSLYQGSATRWPSD